MAAMETGRNHYCNRHPFYHRLLSFPVKRPHTLDVDASACSIFLLYERHDGHIQRQNRCILLPLFSIIISFDCRAQYIDFQMDIRRRTFYSPRFLYHYRTQYFVLFFSNSLIRIISRHQVHAGAHGRLNLFFGRARKPAASGRVFLPSDSNRNSFAIFQ